MKRPELLAPAGNFEKMKAAILYGADAVYLAGQIFGMRAAADNFSIEELAEAVEYAHERNVKVYLTVNTMPREYQYDLLKNYFEEHDMNLKTEKLKVLVGHTPTQVVCGSLWGLLVAAVYIVLRHTVFGIPV